MRVSEIYRNKDEWELNFHVFENMKSWEVNSVSDRWQVQIWEVTCKLNLIVFYKKYVFACERSKERLNIENLRALLVSLIFKAFIDLRTWTSSSLNNGKISLKKKTDKKRWNLGDICFLLTLFWPFVYPLFLCLVWNLVQSNIQS